MIRVPAQTMVQPRFIQSRVAFVILDRIPIQRAPGTVQAFVAFRSRLPHRHRVHHPLHYPHLRLHHFRHPHRLLGVIIFAEVPVLLLLPEFQWV